MKLTEVELFHNVKKLSGNLAWEHGFNRNPPRTVWRVHSVRYWRERAVENYHWFTSEADANAAVDRIEQDEDTVISVTKYERAER